jgi:hypothetical protein
MRTSTKLGCGMLLVLVALIGYGIYYMSFTHWINAGQVGLIYNAQGGLQKDGLQTKVYPPQALTLGYLQQLYTYPTAIQNAVYTQDANAGEVKAADGISITTSDNANTTFDISVVYRILPEDVPTVFKEFGPIPLEDVQANFIRRTVKTGASAVGSKYDLFSLMGPKRQEASDKLTDFLRAELKPKGISVVKAMILTAYPTSYMNQKITTRVNSFISLDISQINNQIAEKEKGTSIVGAQATQKAQEISASGVVGKAQIAIDLDNVDAAIAKWNGHLAPYSKGSKITIFSNGSGSTGDSNTAAAPAPSKATQSAAQDSNDNSSN